MRITVLGAGLPAAGLPAAGPAGTGSAGTAAAGLSLECGRAETVLSALSRQGVRLPSACQAGACRACLVRALHGDPGPAGSAGLEDALRADGYFLACQARPASDLTVALAGGDVYTPARLLSVRRDGPALRVRVRPEQPLSFRAGQHVALRIPAARAGTGRDGDAELVRVYSFANRPAEADRDGAEFYVRVYPGGAMSAWLAGARRGAELSLGRPAGTCCYRPGEPGAPLLLAGTGTGVAARAAGARDALAHGHYGPIVLLRGAADASGLYPEDGLPAAPVRSRTCVLSRGEDIVAAAEAEYAALAESAALADPAALANRAALADPAALANRAALAGPPGTGATQVYLCGGPGVVARMRRALFLAGQSLRHIHFDGFSPAVVDGFMIQQGHGRADHQRPAGS